jgi:hypothetical protein
MVIKWTGTKRNSCETEWNFCETIKTKRKENRITFLIHFKFQERFSFQHLILKSKVLFSDDVILTVFSFRVFSRFFMNFLKNSGPFLKNLKNCNTCINSAPNKENWISASKPLLAELVCIFRNRTKILKFELLSEPTLFEVENQAKFSSPWHSHSLNTYKCAVMTTVCCGKFQIEFLKLIPKTRIHKFYSIQKESLLRLFWALL